MRVRQFRWASVTVISGVIVAASAGAAVAAPADGPDPVSGPATGGTLVTVPTPLGESFTELQPGGLHTLALGADGNAYAWGNNDSGQLGTGVPKLRTTPFPVQLPDGVALTQIDAGAFHSMGIGSDGRTYAWGENEKGQIGVGSTENVLVPTAVEIPGGVPLTQIDAGEYYSTGVGSDGLVYGWGDNYAGQLGNDDTAAALTPVLAQTPGQLRFTQVSAGTHHTLALAEDGSAYAWGRNGAGELGTGNNTASWVPVPVEMPNEVTFTEVSAGGHHSIALASDGSVYAWGTNGKGQLGNSGTTNSNVPVLVDTPDGLSFRSVDAGGLTVPGDEERAEAGGYHSLAIASDGVTYAWGGNLNGQLGNNTTEDQTTPVAVHTPEGVSFTQVGTGLFHSTGLGSDGLAYAWGYNSSGQLGNGSGTDMLVPFPVYDGVTVTGVSFAGIAGTELEAVDGRWAVLSPEHAPGPVDVAVTWTQYCHADAEQCLPRDPVVYPAGYTYAGVPTVTDPTSVSVIEGDEARFTVTVAGGPLPEVRWERSTDGGKTWVPVGAEAAVVTEGATSTLTLTGALADSGTLLRAVATNAAGTATSAAAELTVTAKSEPTTPPTTTPPPTETTPPTTVPSKTPGPATPELANTGADGAAPAAWALGGGLLLAGALVTLRHRIRGGHATETTRR